MRVLCGRGGRLGGWGETWLGMVGGRDGGINTAMASKGAAHQVVLMEKLEADTAGSWDTSAFKLVFTLETFCV